MVIPAAMRTKMNLEPGAELDVTIDDGAIRLVRVVPGPKLVRVGKRLVARPTADRKRLPSVDIARLVEEERSRWPL